MQDTLHTDILVIGNGLGGLAAAWSATKRGCKVTPFIARLAGGLTLEKVILVVLAPLLPIWSVGLRQYSEQKEAADSGFRLKESAEELWETAVASNNGLSERESRELQDSILDHRMRSPLIFDWFYSKHRKQFEAQARRCADEAVQTIAGKCTQ